MVIQSLNLKYILMIETISIIEIGVQQSFDDDEEEVSSGL
jgi:hypothetical protein